MSNTITIKSKTLGSIARKYAIDIRTLYTYIDADTELKQQVHNYTKKVKHKGAKMLPPFIVKRIYALMGED